MKNFFRRLFRIKGKSVLNVKPKSRKNKKYEQLDVDNLSYEDRIKTNTTALETIAKKLGKNAEERKIIKGFFGEKTVKNKSGKTIRKNTLSSKRQTERLQKIIVNIDKGTFNIKNFVARDEKYKDTKGKLDKNPTVSDIIKSLDRSNFYYENKPLILKYNKISSKYGRETANNSDTGIELAEKYVEFQEKQNEELLENLGLK